MEISFASGEKVCFSWRASGELHVELLKADAAHNKWTVVSSARLSGDPLLAVLEGFTLPLLRRALSIAVKFPSR